VGIGVAVVGLILGLIAFRARKTARDFRKQKQMAENEVERRLRGRSQMEAELRQAEEDTAAQLQGLGLPDLAAAEDLLGREEAHVAAIDQLNARLEGLVGRDPIESLAPSRDAAAREAADTAARLAELDPATRADGARERFEAAVKTAEAGVEQARDGEARARAQVDANAVDADQVAGESERLATWREQLAALQRRARVSEAALGGLERATETTMAKATRYLEKGMTGVVARITDGRYRRVRIDDQTLAISVVAPEKGDWVDIRQLSDGTLGQIYLAARLGLIRYATGARRPPLILDDPFVTFDDDHAARGFDILRDLTADHQVIYLTSTDRFDAAAEAVVELPGPTRSTRTETEQVRRRPLTATSLREMDPQTAVIVLGWPRQPSSADFGGGLAGRRAALFRVVVFSLLAGCGSRLRARRRPGRARAGPPEVALALVASVFGGIGIGALYGGLAGGRWASWRRSAGSCRRSSQCRRDPPPGSARSGRPRRHRPGDRRRRARLDGAVGRCGRGRRAADRPDPRCPARRPDRDRRRGRARPAQSGAQPAAGGLGVRPARPRPVGRGGGRHRRARGRSEAMAAPAIRLAPRRRRRRPRHAGNALFVMAAQLGRGWTSRRSCRRSTRWPPSHWLPSCSRSGSPASTRSACRPRSSRSCSSVSVDPDRTATDRAGPGPAVSRRSGYFQLRTTVSGTGPVGSAELTRLNP
jgi:hypothetical protein